MLKSFSKSKRYSKSEWIRLVLAQGQSAVGQFLILRFMKGAIEETDSAYVVSRKIGQAVERNRVKRRMRELFRTRMRSSAAPGFYLFIARTSCSQATFKQLENDMVDLMGRAATMRSTPIPENGHLAPLEPPEK